MRSLSSVSACLTHRHGLCLVPLIDNCLLWFSMRVKLSCWTVMLAIEWAMPLCWIEGYRNTIKTVRESWENVLHSRGNVGMEGQL